MVYNMKKYLKELKTNPHWEIEPHFWYYCQINILKYFQTAMNNNFTTQDLESALYGQFVVEGKPILEGFIENLNVMIKLVRKILKNEKV